MIRWKCRGQEISLDSGSMKVALLLCIVGWYSGPLLVCTAEDAKLLSKPDQSTVSPAQLEDLHRAGEGASHASDGASQPRAEERAGSLNRVSRAARAFEDASGSVDDYGVLRAAMTPPRRHRFLHFGRKRALSAPYYGSPVLNSEDTASGEEGAEWSGGEDEDDGEATASQEGPEASALQWAKRALRDGPNSFLHFGKREPEEKASGGEQLRFRRSVQEVNSGEGAKLPKTRPGDFGSQSEQVDSTDSEHLAPTSKTKRSPNRIMHFGKRLPSDSTVGESDGVKRASHNSIMHFGKRTNEQDVAAALENVYSTMDGALDKRAANRMMHFGKRDPEYGVSTGLEGEPEFEIVSADKKAPNRILHFGKRPSNSGEVDAEFEDAEKEKRGNRIMHFGKREGKDSSGMTLPSMDEAPSATDKRAASARSKYTGRPDQLQPFGGIGRQLQRQFQEWKKRNRILHFGKREPQQRSSSYYQQKRLGNRIMHFGKRAGYTFYAEGPGSAAAATKDKRLKHSIMHFGKREEELASAMGNDKRNRIMHFGKRIGNNDQEYQFQQQLPMDKRAGNRIMHFGKRLQAPTSGNAWDYGIEAAAGTSRAAAIKRAHRILHFGKRDGGTSYDDAGAGTDPLIMAEGLEEADSSNVSGGRGQSGNQKVIRKKRSTAPDESSDYIDDTLAQMMGDLMGEDGYADRITMGHSGLSGPLHLPHAYVAAQVYGNAFPRMLSRPSRSDRLFRALYSGEHGAEMMPKGQSRNVFLHFG
ncbi:hypothetical protein HPB50_005655 [Hyalomma asiaticum]|uniref:Uncharacterized protein n=1 Tax=Hyalomma asiaticum TaxID=266040 RepID=A0ACB7RNF1_HYAAI|nr:hypothetical protein HPB50_005655 [Hyalomma asiaticum]